MAENETKYTKTPVLAKVKIGGNDYWLKDADARAVIDSIIADYLKAADKTALKTEIGKKVDKVEGKSLIDDAEITRLAGIESGAQVNVIEKIKINGAEVAVGEGKLVDLGTMATSAEFTALQNRVKAVEDDYLKEADKTEVEGKITAEETRAKDVEEGLDGRLEAIEDDYLVEADKTELQDSIDAKQDILGFEGEYNKETNKVATKSYVDTEIGKLATIHIEVVDELPTSGQKENYIYLVPKGEGKTGYKEYIWVAKESKFEEIGDTDIDLTGYRTSAAQDVIDNEIKGRLDVIQGSAAGSIKAAVEAEKTRAEGVESELDAAIKAIDNHSHANKAELDTIKSGDVAKWNAEIGANAAVTALSEGQVATNKANIEALQGTVGDKDSGLVKGLADEIKRASDAEDALDDRIKVFEEGKTDYDDAVDKKHTHENADILDDIGADNLLDEGQKTKLAGIEAGAQVNVIESISMNGATLAVTNKGVNLGNIASDDRVTALENEFKDNGRVPTAEGKITELEDAVSTLEEKPAYDITADQISNWDNEVGAKAAAAAEETRAKGVESGLNTRLASVENSWYNVEVVEKTINVGGQTATVEGQTIQNVKATGDINGTATVSASTATVSSAGKFTPAGSVTVTLKDANVLASVRSAGTLPTYTHTGFSGGSLGNATKADFVKKGVKFSIDETDEECLCLDYVAATDTEFYGKAVSEQGTYTAAVYGTDTFTQGAMPEFIEGTVGVQAAEFEGTEGNLSVSGEYSKVDTGAITVTATGVSLNVGDIAVAPKTITTADKEISVANSFSVTRVEPEE